MGSTVQKIILCLTRTCSPIASGFLLITIINIPLILLSMSLKSFCAWLAGLADGGQHISRPLRQLQLRRLLLQVSTYPTKISVKTIIILFQAGLAARSYCRRWSRKDIANNITNHKLSQLIKLWSFPRHGSSGAAKWCRSVSRRENPSGTNHDFYCTYLCHTDKSRDPALVDYDCYHRPLCHNDLSHSCWGGHLGS